MYRVYLRALFYRAGEEPGKAQESITAFSLNEAYFVRAALAGCRLYDQET